MNAQLQANVIMVIMSDVSAVQAIGAVPQESYTLKLQSACILNILNSLI